MTKNEREQLVAYRIGRATDTLAEIDILIENRLWNTAINRMYYACFYSVTALLVKNHIEARSHAGVRQMFGLHFVKTNKIAKEHARFYSDLFDRRQTGDYDDFLNHTEEEVLDLHPLAKELYAN